jgi:hypothetical protein
VRPRSDRKSRLANSQLVSFHWPWSRRICGPATASSRCIARAGRESTAHARVQDCRSALARSHLTLGGSRCAGQRCRATTSTLGTVRRALPCTTTLTTSATRRSPTRSGLSATERYWGRGCAFDIAAPHCSRMPPPFDLIVKVLPRDDPLRRSYLQRRQVFVRRSSRIWGTAIVSARLHGLSFYWCRLRTASAVQWGSS